MIFTVTKARDYKIDFAITSLNIRLHEKRVAVPEGLNSNFYAVGANHIGATLVPESSGHFK